MHVLITGGAGFIGNNLIRTLFREQPDILITCIDNFDPFYDQNIKEYNIRDLKNQPGFQLFNTDLSETSAAKLKDLINDKPDAIIHMAARAGVRPSIEDPEAYQRINILGLQHLLEYAKEESITQFIFASSSSVYGINDHFPWQETEMLMPISPYAMTKQAGEMLGHVYSKLYGIRFIALRFFTVYGPSQRPDLAIHKFTKNILEGKPITMYGDGDTSRDYTYVDDIVSGVIAALHYTRSDFEIINLGNHYAVALHELIAHLENIIGIKASIEKMPEQPGDVKTTYADITKAKQLLNYSPSTKLDEGLQQFVNWYKKMKQGIS